MISIHLDTQQCIWYIELHTTNSAVQLKEFWVPDIIVKISAALDLRKQI